MQGCDYLKSQTIKPFTYNCSKCKPWTLVDRAIQWKCHQLIYISRLQVILCQNRTCWVTSKNGPSPSAKIWVVSEFNFEKWKRKSCGSGKGWISSSWEGQILRNSWKEGSWKTNQFWVNAATSGQSWAQRCANVCEKVYFHYLVKTRIPEHRWILSTVRKSQCSPMTEASDRSGKLQRS